MDTITRDEANARCDECGSAFIADRSRMAALCPECAHALYDHAPCLHDMKAGSCVLCGWDGSRSEYIRTLLDRRSTQRAVSAARGRVLALAVVLGVAAIHLARVGAHLTGAASRFYSSYASDVLLPLGMYFVLCLSERLPGFLANWKAKAVVVFAAASLAEALQGLGVPALGRTFDPIDFVMYAAGVLAAVLLDRIAFRRGGVPFLSCILAVAALASGCASPCSVERLEASALYTIR